MNLSTYLKEIQKELSLTTFPSQTTVINFTLFVIIFTSVMAVYLGALDLGFGDIILKGINSYRTGESITATSTATSTATTSNLNNLLVPTNIQISTTTAK